MCCILYVFYIKPQPYIDWDERRYVVFFTFSTSNHNHSLAMHCSTFVVFFTFSTSNHNLTVCPSISSWLYSLRFLHQTTTCRWLWWLGFSCILYVFYIKPQLLGSSHFRHYRCILYVFYIKPQLKAERIRFVDVVFFTFSTSNHNRS